MQLHVQNKFNMTTAASDDFNLKEWYKFQCSVFHILQLFDSFLSAERCVLCV